MKNRFILFFLFLVLGLPTMTMANSQSVVINEITWMGTDVSYNDEWIELYNNTENNISLDGWVLKAEDGTPEINLTGEIPAQGFYLLERTNDETVPEIGADLIYKGALRNDGENLKLYDNSGNLVDQVICQDGWPAGNNQTKQTMEKTEIGEWQTSSEPDGTPKKVNSKQEEKLPEIKLPEIEPQIIEYPKGIIFNEIMPSPEGPDETEEWIKISNQNDFAVDLSSWQIKDKEGKITTYTFPKETKIPALGYLVLKRPETKITLNNDGDGLEIINPNGEIVDSMNFEKSLQNQSYLKTSSDWAWSGNLTTAKSEDGPRIAEKQTAAIADIDLSTIDLSTQKPKPPVLLIALIITIFSAIVILILKKLILQNLVNKV